MIPEYFIAKDCLVQFRVNLAVCATSIFKEHKYYLVVTKGKGNIDDMIDFI